MKEHISIEKGVVRYSKKIIPDCDAAHFTISTHGVSAQDGKCAYIEHGKKLYILHDADAKTLRDVGDSKLVSDFDHLFELSSWDLETRIDPYSRYNEELMYNEDIGKHESPAMWLLRHYPNEKGWWHPDYRHKYDASTHTISGFHIEKDSVYFLGNHQDFSPIFFHTKKPTPINLAEARGPIHYLSAIYVRGADAQHFKPLDHLYGTSKNLAFFRWRPLPNADAASLQTLGYGFARDNTHLYYEGRPVTVQDIDSFTLTPDKKDPNFLDSSGPFIAEDAYATYQLEHNLLPWEMRHRHLIMTAKKTPAVKAKNTRNTASSIKDARFSDAWSIHNGVVMRHGKKTTLDAASFRFLFSDKQNINQWAVDKDHLYNANGWRVIKHINGSQFTMLNEFWGKDDKTVFCFRTERELKGADVQTFQIIGDKGEAEDNIYNYYFDDCGSIKKKKKKG